MNYLAAYIACSAIACQLIVPAGPRFADRERCLRTAPLAAADAPRGEVQTLVCAAVPVIGDPATEPRPRPARHHRRIAAPRKLDKEEVPDAAVTQLNNNQLRLIAIASQ